MKIGDKVKYIGSSEEQNRWGNNDDPALYLKVGDTVTISTIELHSWHTKVYFREIPGKYNSVCFEPVAILTLPEEKKNTMENMTIEEKANEYTKQYLPHVNTTGHWLGFQDGYKQALSESIGSVAAQKEEELTAQVELIAWCFYGIGAVGWDMNPHITWGLAWDKFKQTGELPSSDWKNRRFREVSNCNLLSELASLRQQLKEREEALKELLKFADMYLNSKVLEYARGNFEKSDLEDSAAIIDRARKLLSK